MNKVRLYVLLAISILIFGIMTLRKQQNPEKIYFNGNIWTGVLNAQKAEAIVINGNKIVEIGSNDLLNKYDSPEIEKIDLEGEFVVPGLIDAHTHFLSGGFQLTQLNLRKAKSKENFISGIKDYAESVNDGRWILGGDWDHESWGGELPSKTWIDSVTQDNPVYLHRLDGHMGLANSKALELAGVFSDTPDPPGGLIIRNESEEPTGILKDKAQKLVRNFIPEPTDDEKFEALSRAMEFAASQGITQVHDMCTWDDLKIYRKANKRGEVKTRINAYVWYTNFEKLLDLIESKGKGDNWVKWGGVKAMVDGSLGSRTAWMHEPYRDDPSTSGLLVLTDSTNVKKMYLKGDDKGIQFAMHAIGDRANDWILAQYKIVTEKNGLKDRRFRIEHAQHLSPDAVNKMGKLNVIASMQPYHLIDDGRWARKRMDDELLKTSYANKSLLDGGVTLAFGSDWTVAPMSPLKGIHAAVTRETLDGKNPGGWYPEQKISLEDALIAYTVGAAYAGFQEEILGTLEKGKLADFVVLSEDLFEIDPITIKDVNVVRTVTDGIDQFIAQE